MKVEIDDEFMCELVVSMLNTDRDNLKEYLATGNYWLEEDRFYDERLLAALEVVLENYSVPGVIQGRLF